MFCPKCGVSLPEGTNFCYSCGERQPEAEIKLNQDFGWQQKDDQQQGQSQYNQASPFDNCKIVEEYKRESNEILLFAILSLVFMGGLIGLILGIIALSKISKIVSPQVYANESEMKELESIASQIKVSKILATIAVVVSVVVTVLLLLYFVGIILITAGIMSAVF